MEQQLCMLACGALGELGILGELVTLIVAAVALGYGTVQRKRTKATETQVSTLAAERDKLENRVQLLSLRPPPTPIVIHAPPALTPPSESPLPRGPDEPPPDESLG
jgi:hypothetical protein